MFRLISLLILTVFSWGCLGQSASHSDPSAVTGAGGGEKPAIPAHSMEGGSTQAGNPALSLEPRNPSAKAEVVRGEDDGEASAQIFYDWEVRWDPPEAPIVSYEVERRIGQLGAWERIGTLDSEHRTFEEQGAYGATHYFRVKAVNAEGQFAYSAEVTDRTPAYCEFGSGWAMVFYSLGCFEWRSALIRDPENAFFLGTHKDGRLAILHRQNDADGEPSFKFQYPSREEIPEDIKARESDKKGLATYPELQSWSHVVTDVFASGDQTFVTTSEGFILEKTDDDYWRDLWTRSLYTFKMTWEEKVKTLVNFAPKPEAVEKFRPNLSAKFVDILAVSEKEIYLLEDVSGRPKIYHVDGVNGMITNLTPVLFGKGTPLRLWSDSARIYIATSEGIYAFPRAVRSLRQVLTSIVKLPAEEAPPVPPAFPTQKIPGTDYEITALAKINESNQWAIVGRRHLFRYCH